MASSSGIKLGRAYVLIDAVDRTKQACNAALRNISTLADNVMAIGTNMTIGATIAVTLDASASRAFREFEETMLKVKAKSKDTAGATVAAYDRLIEKAQQLGRVTKFTAPQIADAMAGMAAAGLSRSTIDKSIKNVLDLAVATGVEIPTASRIAMAAMQQFNMTAEQSAEICDVLSAAVNNSALTIEDIGETFKYSAPLAREFGMDMKQLATVIAALGNAGIKGSQAGTSLRQMMVKLAKPGKYNLDQFNQDFEANVQRDIVVNEGGVLRKKTRPVIEILRDMGKAMDEFEKKHPDVDPQKKLAVFADLFGRYAMTSGATLADNMKNIDTLMKAINNSSGTAGKTAGIMNSGVVGMHYAFISAWQDVAIQYGKAINETVMTFYEGFTKIAHYISNFIQNNQNVINIITSVTAATGALGVSMIAGAGAVKTFAVVGGMFTSTVGAMSSAAYGFAIALNSWINPLISVQGLMRGLAATIAGTTVVGRGIGGVISSFGSRWNLPWQNAPAGARRLTRGQSRVASRLLASYYSRSSADIRPAGLLHDEIRRRELARAAALRYSLTPEGRLASLDERLSSRGRFGGLTARDIRVNARHDVLRNFNESQIAFREALRARNALIASTPRGTVTPELIAANAAVQRTFRARTLAERAVRANWREYSMYLRPHVDADPNGHNTQRMFRTHRRFFNNDFGHTDRYLRERMRMLRLAGFYDMTAGQHRLRSSEIIMTRRLMTANNMMLGRQRWGAFFRPFTDALQRATRAVGQFGMQVLSSITRMGIHPIRGARSLIANAGSMLFAGLAPGGGIMKGIGATFKFAFTYLKRGLVPVMQTLLRLAVQFATAPLTWAAGLTYATLQGGKLKEVMAGVYIAISAIGVGVSKLWEQLKNLFSWLGKSIKENMAQSNAIIDPVINMWKGTFSRLFDDMKGSFSVITEAIGAGRWGDAFKVLGAQWRVIRAELSATLRNNWEHMKYTFMTVWNRVVDYFQNGEGLWGIVKWVVESLWGITKYAVSGIYNAVSWGLAEITGYGHTAQVGGTTVWTRYGMANANAKYLGATEDVLSELKDNKIELDLSKYPYLKGWLEAQKNPNWENATRTEDSNGRSYITSGYIRGVGYKLGVDRIRAEYQELLLEAQALIAGKEYSPKTPENGYGLMYTPEQIKEQYENTFGKSGGLKDVSDDKEVIEARRYLDETKSGVRGNVERQEAAKAAQQLKEREEGVVKELGEEGVGRIAGLLEGFYDFSDVSENRKKGLILAAGEYITEMGISIDKFAEIIETIKKLPGFGGSANAKLFSEKSNIELYANLADNAIRAGMDALTEDSFKDGIKFTLTDNKGKSVEKVLNREKDGTLQTRFEQLKELGDVLATLSPDQKRDVRAQFVGQYGEDATSAIENALDAIFQRNKVIDFSEEKARYAGMSNENLNNALSVLDFADQTVSDETKKKLKDTFADEFEEITPEAITKDAIYQTSFGENKVTSDTYQPEKVKDYTRLTKELQGTNGKTPDEIAELAMQAYQLKKTSKTGAFSTIADAAGFINDINTFNLPNSKDLDKKVKYYGGDVEGLTNMEKLSLVKEREGVAGLMKFLPKQGAMFEKSKDFANWLKAPEENKKPQVWTVVQANIKDMLSTFKAFADNRNRVILDRRAKEEKDAKAKEEEAKKARGEDIEGRLKSIEDGIDNLSACVDGNGSKRFNINMEYA